MKLYRVWVSGQKERTLVIREFPSAICARLWLAAQYNRKTYDIVAVRARAYDY